MVHSRHRHRRRHLTVSGFALFYSVLLPVFGSDVVMS